MAWAAGLFLPVGTLIKPHVTHARLLRDFDPAGHSVSCRGWELETPGVQPFAALGISGKGTLE